jgi:hypothetical protein
MLARRAHHEGVPVGLGLGDVVGGDVAAGAGLVLDDELLAELLGDLGRDDPRRNIGGLAGLERNDELHRPRRPFGGVRPARQQRHTAESSGAGQHGAAVETELLLFANLVSVCAVWTG